ncbi:hypothetical protein PMZ80_002483 [Knufia obscura]|uniref:DUF7624 domain-containing protein n=1 Tax=Knufia obscura TaxID=1635080 RepID=A0ABR0RYW7_9EURO|nr:hypothetical protein PMZ80_002483 [Knufia obscura]
MAAVKPPHSAQALFPRSFSPVPDSPWPNSALTPSSNAAYQNMFPQNKSNLSATPGPEEATTPSDITAPSPSTSETSTVFTDVDGEEEPRSAQPDEERAIDVEPSSATSVKSAASNLKIDTAPLNPAQRLEEDEPPQSVIHIPSSFGRWQAQGGNKAASLLAQSHRNRRSLSQSSTTSGPSTTDQPLTTPIPRPSTAASDTTTTTESTVPSESTLRPETESQSADEANSQFYDNQMPPSPLMTQVPTAKDWASTPRAQTRQELSFSRPGSSLASGVDPPVQWTLVDRRTGIREGDDVEESERFTTDASADELDHLPRRRSLHRRSDGDIEALEVALAECWTLCNTLASLSNRHRDRLFLSSSSTKGDMHEKAWKSCWKLCQNLYETRDVNAVGSTKNTLSLCREFCQSLFEVRIRKDEAADSVLRVSFELNNHLFNTHDRTLPDAFRERTLDFYITLCHRLMKQKSKMAAESDSLLRACWTLAEMLFSLRQSKRENRKPDQELLGSAMQACWELCDLFREGWTQIRPDRGTPRATQTTFSQAFQLARRAGYIEDQHTLKFSPETPTTIFDDTATISPEEAPIPTISVMDHGVPQSAKSTASAPPAFPRPNTTQRMSRQTMMQRQQQNRWASINEVVSEEEAPSRPTSAMSQSSRASSTHMSITSLTSSQNTIRTPSEDPSLTLLKALFVRAAVQTGRGFSPDPRNQGGRDAVHTSLPHFARSLPDTAFGTQVWQKTLLENYKKAVAQDSTFKHLGTSATTIGVGPDPEKGKEEIAQVLKGMVDNTIGWAWLRDLFRYGYGAYIDEVISKTNKEPPAPTEARPRALPGNSGRSNSVGSGKTLPANGNGNEGKKVSPPRR